MSKPTPLARLLFDKGLDLIDLKASTGISYPVLVNIKRGYKMKTVKNRKGKILKKERMRYEPEKRTLRDIAEYFKVPVEQVYEHRYEDTNEEAMEIVDSIEQATTKLNNEKKYSRKKISQ